MKNKILILFIIFLSNCSNNIIKKRLMPPHKVKNGILFQYDSPSARHVNLAGNFPDNEWLKNGDRIDVMNDEGLNGDKIAGDALHDAEDEEAIDDEFDESDDDEEIEGAAV